MRNKIAILILLSLTIVGCNSQNDKNIISDFLENIVRPQNDMYKITTFLNVSDSLKADTDTYKGIQFNIQFLRNEINSHDDPLKILTYDEFKKEAVFEAYKINYEGKDKVFCIVQANRFITPILINKNGKITAFFTGIVKHKNNIVPYILK